MKTYHKIPWCRNTQQGFALLPVAIVITVIASIALLINSQSAMNVNNVASQNEKTEVEYLAQAALEHALWTANNSGCTGYTLSATSFGSNSYSATFTPADDSPVTITATGTLANGVSHTITRNNAQIMDPSIKTTVLQPGPVAGIDTYIWDGAHKNTNFGTTNRLELNNQSAERNILIRFDLSSLPSSAKIISATLELYLNGGSDLSNGVIDVHRITRSWFEGVDDDKDPPTAPGATYEKYDSSSMFGNWSAPGGDYDPTPLATTTIPSLLAGWYQWDITEAAIGGPQSILAGNGVLLTASGGSVDKINFSSSDDIVSSQAPKLTVAYNCECGQTCSISTPSKLLMVVSDPANIDVYELMRKELIESWGYTVSLIDDSALINEFDTAITSADVVYISATTEHLELNTKLLDAGIGVVNEEINLAPEFKISDTRTMREQDAFNILDNSHFITSGFALGSFTLYSSVQPSGLVITPASGTQVLGEMNNVGPNWDPSLVVVESGAQLIDGSSAAGRRVQLPWDDIDFSSLSEDSKVIMRRAIEWGAGTNGEVVTPGKVAHWKLDETSGIVALDSEGGHHGELINGPVWDSGGKTDGALQFDGVNDQIVVPHDDTLSLTSEFTISAWVRNDSPSISDSYRILSKESNGANDNYWLSFQNKTFWVGIGANFFSAPNSFEPNIWYHLAVSFSDEANSVVMYVDGIEVSNVTTTATLTPNNEPLYIGANWQSYKYWDGLLDDVRIYDRALVASEVAELAASSGGESGGGSTCPADFIPDTKESEFSTSSLDISDPWGITFLLPGTTFNSVAAPVDGAWLLVDGSNRVLNMTDMNGTLLTRTSISISAPRGITYVNSGVWNNHLALADPSNKRVYFLDLNANVKGNFSTAGITEHPVGLTLIKTSASGTYDDHLAISSDKDDTGSSNAGIFIVDQNGNLKTTIDISGFVTEPWGIAHVPGKDAFLIADKSGAVYIIGFDGILQDQYSAASFGATQQQSIAINLLTSAHAVLDKDTNKVMNLASSTCGGGGGGCDGTYRDEFNARSYGNNDGTLTWSTDWLEINESNGPASGDEAVDDNDSTYHLQVRDNDGGGEGVQREADLSANTSAVLSFEYRRDGFDNGNDYVMVHVSDNGGSSWAELDRIVGPGTDSSYVPKNYDISAYIAPNTRIRFLTSPDHGSGDELYIDNVQIEVKGCAK